MTLQAKKIAVLATDGFEDSELNEPCKALQDEHAEVVFVSDKKQFEGKNGTKITANQQVDDADSEEFDALLLPGGVANPDHMRMNKKAVKFVRDFFDEGKPVAAICHGPWLLIEAGVVDGRKVTSWPSLTTDLTNAGAQWFDEEVVVDNGLVTSRNPDDIPAFNKKMIEEFAEGQHAKQTA
jgi:protease I